MLAKRHVATLALHSAALYVNVERSASGVDTADNGARPAATDCARQHSVHPLTVTTTTVRAGLRGDACDELVGVW